MPRRRHLKPVAHKMKQATPPTPVPALATYEVSRDPWQSYCFSRPHQPTVHVDSVAEAVAEALVALREGKRVLVMHRDKAVELALRK